MPLTVSAREEIDGKTSVEKQHDQAININFLSLRRVLDDGSILLIRLPLAAVTESAAYAGNSRPCPGCWR
jgi:hypothetical protein